jgi:hypothetical protein
VGVMAFSAGNSTDQGFTPPSVSTAPPSGTVIVGNAARAGSYFSLATRRAARPSSGTLIVMRRIAITSA